MRRALSLLLLGSLPAAALADDGWSARVALGGALNLKTALEVRQEGLAPVRVDSADYETRPLESPFYYSLRGGRWRGRRGWEVELVHHKIFLRDPPAEIQFFAVSHGYNLVTVNRGWQLGRVIVRLGAGVVVAHPESTVRGRTLPEEGGLFESGYHLTGPALQGAVERRFDLGERGRWFLTLEGKATAARAVLPVAAGEAEAPNLALHALAGLGYHF
jgi:hypothetical protein